MEKNKLKFRYKRGTFQAIKYTNLQLCKTEPKEDSAASS